MTSRTVAQLLADLGVTRSHSRPHVSNDNPYSEAQFKTLKNTPRFPERFTSLAHARTFTDAFFAHYNHQHRHSGIGYHTPASVHAGHHHTIRAHRQAVLDHAYTLEPHRFRQPPIAPQVPSTAWINQPEPNLSHTPYIFRSAATLSHPSFTLVTDMPRRAPNERSTTCWS